MTPQEAQEALEWWKCAMRDRSSVNKTRCTLASHRALRAIADMYYEYDYEVAFGDEWTAQGYSFVTLEDAQRRLAERRRRTPARIIRRLVTEWEVVE